VDQTRTPGHPFRKLSGANDRGRKRRAAGWALALGGALLLCAAPYLRAAGPAQEPAQAEQEPAQPAQEQAQPGQVSTGTRATVRGTVKNSATGEPLPRALVQIEGDADTGTLTDGEGQFEIPGVPVGPQAFRVVKPGFRDRPYATEETGLQSEGPAHSILVSQQMPELGFALTPNASIRGHIDLSTGDPAAGITVNLFKQVVRFGRAIWSEESNSTANGDGIYRFGSLPEGVYALSTQPVLESEPAVSVVASGSSAKITRNGYPSVYYPDARDFTGAALVRLSAGSQAEANFSLALEPFYPVSISAGAQSRETGGDRGATTAFTATVMDATGHQLAYPVQYDDVTHSLQANLPDGNYTINVRGSLQPSLAETGQRAGGGHSNAVTGTIACTVAGHAVTGLRVPLAPPPQNVVRLRFLHTSDRPAVARGNGGDLVNLSIDLADSVPNEGNENVWTMNNSQDSIDFTARPGSYWVTAFLPRRNVCAGTFTAGGSNLAREPLVLSPGAAPPPMEFILRDDCASLTLTLPPALTGFEPGEEPFYIVYLVPDFDTVQDIPPMTMHPSSGPSLTIDGLTPGSYHVYTFTGPVHLEYRNPAALSALSAPGQQVTVGAGTTATVALEATEH